MADAPERIWAGSCAALGAPDTGFWYPVRTPSTPTPYIRADLVDELVKALDVCVATIERVNTSEGVCCCGDPIDGHGYSSGHSPVDAGDYYARCAVDAAKAALTRIKGDEK